MHVQECDNKNDDNPPFRKEGEGGFFSKINIEQGLDFMRFSTNSFYKDH